jgi:hypothetical protein
MKYSIEELPLGVFPSQIISAQIIKLENIERNVKSFLEC